MARDSSLPLRKAIVSHLRSDADVTAFVPAARIYGMATPPNPTRPFIRYTEVAVLPEQASCVDGSRVRVRLDAFSDQESEDEVSTISAAIARSLGGNQLPLDTSYDAIGHLIWLGGQLLPDGDQPRTWQMVNRFEAVVVS